MEKFTYEACIQRAREAGWQSIRLCIWMVVCNAVWKLYPQYALVWWARWGVLGLGVVGVILSYAQAEMWKRFATEREFR